MSLKFRVRKILYTLFGLALYDDSEVTRAFAYEYLP
jgi:hypothetical protein